MAEIRSPVRTEGVAPEEPGRGLAKEIFDKMIDAVVGPEPDFNRGHQLLRELRSIKQTYPSDPIVLDYFHEGERLISTRSGVDLAQEPLLQGIDATIERLDIGIARENAALDQLLRRLAREAA